MFITTRETISMSKMHKMSLIEIITYVHTYNRFWSASTNYYSAAEMILKILEEKRMNNKTDRR